MPDPTNTEICSECRLPKSKEGMYSLTQWISTCVCDVVDERDEQYETILFCQSCKKRVLKARDGSFTQWILRSDLCSCEEPDVKKTRVSRNFNDQESSQDDTTNQVFEEDLEEEITLSEVKFPIERYKPIGILGQGSTGNVYLCRDRTLNKKVAVKCLNYITDELLVSFQQEAKINSRLDHPNIAKIIDFGIYQNTSPYMVVQYIEGLSLEHYISAQGAPDRKLALTILIQICNALEYAHGEGVLHRDVKPGNVLFFENDNGVPVAVLIDFGLAKKSLDNDQTDDSQAVVGTPNYISPDQANGLKYDQRSEIYSIGCTAFELLAGSPPFEADTAVGLLSKHASERVPSLSERSPDSEFSDELEELISKCLEKEPEHRFNNVQDLRADLENIYALEKEDDVKEVSNKTTSSIGNSGVSVKLLFIPLAIIVLSLVAYLFVEHKKTKKAPIKTEKLVSPHTENDVEGVLTGSEITFANIDGYKHPSNVLGFVDEDMKKLRGKGFDSISFYAHSIDGSGLVYLKEEPIKRLALDYSQVTDSAMDTVNENLPGLEELSLEYIKITDAGIKKLDNLKHLKVLTLNGAKGITDNGVDIILKNFPNLVKLSLKATSVTDKGVSKLTGLKRLKILFLDYTDVSDKGVEKVCQLPLAILFLTKTRVTDKSLKRVAKVKTLRQLSLASCPGITQEGVAALKKKRPRLGIMLKDDTNPLNVPF